MMEWHDGAICTATLARFFNRFGDAPAANQIVEDLRAGKFLERIDADEGRDHISADQLRFLVDDEHAIGVAVERGTQVAAVFADGLLQVDHVLGFDGACRMVRKGAVELEVERDHLARQILEDVRHGLAAHPVPRVDRDLERLDLFEIDEREAVFCEVVEHVSPG